MNNHTKIYSESIIFLKMYQFYISKELFITTLSDILSVPYFQIKLFSILNGTFCQNIYEMYKIFNIFFLCYTTESIKRNKKHLKSLYCMHC